MRISQYCIFLLAVYAPLISSAFANEPIVLESQHLVVRIDPDGAGITAIENRLTSSSITIRSVPFRLVTTRGEFTAGDFKLAGLRREKDSATFTFAGQGLEVEIRYQVDSPQANAVRKFIKVTNKGDQPLTLYRLTMFDWSLPATWPSGYPHSYAPNGINEIHFHKSGVWDDHSINLFLRDEAGGLFMGVENPFFEARWQAKRKVYPSVAEVAYWPRWRLKSGASFESDAGFVGVYRQEKIYMVSPYRVHFDGRERSPFEILDWGEVWAMQRYMESIMPPPEGPYYMVYWQRADPGRLGQIARRQERGEALNDEERAMLKHFGGGPINFREKELWYRLTPATVRFYKQVIDDMAFLGHYQSLFIPNEMVGHSGWFVSPEQEADKAKIEALTDSWFDQPAFPAWQEVADYASAKGIGMCTFLLNQPYRQDRPDWKTLDANGHRGAGNCMANPEFLDWYIQRLDRLFSTHPIRHVQWDEGWMGGDCHDQNHGHPTGNVSYQQFHYVSSALEMMKRKHPDVHFFVITGVYPAMPWIMKHLEAETHTGFMMKYLGEEAAWFDRNVFFLPSYKIHREGGVHWLIDRGSAGVERTPEAVTNNWYKTLEDPTARADYKKNWDRWMNWIEENRQYLNRRRDLFLSPQPATALQGTAHCLGNHGYIFLHNAGTETIAGEIPINHWLGLDEKGDQTFRIRQIYPATDDFGVYGWNTTLTLAVAAGQTVVLNLEPAVGNPVDPRAPHPPPNTRIQKAFLNLAEVINMLNEGDYWPSAPLPGRSNMPAF